MSTYYLRGSMLTAQGYKRGVYFDNCTFLGKCWYFLINSHLEVRYCVAVPSFIPLATLRSIIQDISITYSINYPTILLSVLLRSPQNSVR